MAEQLPKEQLLLKLLNMTTAQEDNVALIAIRKANELLKSSNWDWEKLLAGKIKVVADPFAGAQYRGARVGAQPQPRQAPQPASPPPPPPPPPPPLWQGRFNWHTQTPEHPYYNPDMGYWQRTPYVAPTSKAVDSTWVNQYAGHCFCCGIYVDGSKGFLFKPHSKPEVICAPCNRNKNLVVPPKAAKRITPSSVDILNMFGTKP